MERSNQAQKGATTNTYIKAKSWMARTLAVLSLIVVASMTGVVILTIGDQPVPETLFVLGAVAAGGLVRLLISPLHQALSE
jgi:hypothetical protein